MANSLDNLGKKKGWLLTILNKGMPDVVTFLRGMYIRTIGKHTARIRAAVDTVEGASFFIVVTLEEEPVEQSFEVSEIVQVFGGKVAGVIANRVRWDEMGPAQRALITRLEDHNAKVILSEERRLMHDEGPEEKRRSLLIQGKEICEAFGL